MNNPISIFQVQTRMPLRECPDAHHLTLTNFHGKQIGVTP